MDSTTVRKPSLQARAEYLRRVQSRKRTADVGRTPNGPLAPSMANAQDALSLALVETQHLVPEESPGKVRLMTRASKYRQRAGALGTCTYAREATIYGVHYRSRLTGQGRKWYVRNDAWARARSTRVGRARLAKIIIRPVAVPEYPEGVPANGVVPTSWDERHNPAAIALRAAKRFSQTREKSPWVAYESRNVPGYDGWVTWVAHAETGEVKAGSIKPGRMGAW